MADIRSNVSITQVKIIYYRFFSSPGIWGSSSRGHYSSDDDSYSFNISLIRGITSLSLSEDTHYPKGSKFFYRIVAKDKLGNTAVSKTYSFTIN